MVLVVHATHDPYATHATDRRSHCYLRVVTKTVTATLPSNLGTLLMELPSRQSEAVTHLETTVTLQPDHVEARVNLGVMLSDIPGRSQEAIGHLEFAVAKRPELGRLRELIREIRSRR